MADVHLRLLGSGSKLEVCLETKMKTLMLTLLIAFPTLSAIGQTTDNYSKVRQIQNLSEKKRFVFGLDKADRVKLWKRHNGYVLATEDLTDEQEEFLPRSFAAYERDEMTEELEQEASDLFPAELGEKVFIPGPYTQAVTIIPKVSVFAFARTSCNCRQTGTNWSCSGHCDPTDCTPTQAGCSIYWAYPCNGTCLGNTRGCIPQRRRMNEV
jgi:hypothetical protein